MSTAETIRDEADAQRYANYLEAHGIRVTCVNPECPGREDGKPVTELVPWRRAEVGEPCGDCSRMMLQDWEIKETGKCGPKIKDYTE